jgi:hypothetical protein
MSSVKLSEATKIDFTGTVNGGFEKFSAYNDDVKKLLRSGKGSKVCVIIDRGYGFKEKAPYVVRDHLNLTGYNPLVGPNDPCGERFPAVNSTYIAEGGVGNGVKQAVVAGLRDGVVPTADDIAFLQSVGADGYSYNLVPAMIIAAHAGWKVLGIVVPEGVDANSVISNLDKGEK